MYLLNGLGPEYESMVSALTTSTYQQSVQDVMAYLLTHENHIESKLKTVNTDGTPPTANLMTQSQHSTENDSQKNNSSY